MLSILHAIESIFPKVPFGIISESVQLHGVVHKFVKQAASFPSTLSIRPKPKAVLWCAPIISKSRLLLCMLIKINSNRRHKSQDRIDIKLSSITCGSSSHLASLSD